MSSGEVDATRSSSLYPAGADAVLQLGSVRPRVRDGVGTAAHAVLRDQRLCRQHGACRLHVRARRGGLVGGSLVPPHSQSPAPVRLVRGGDRRIHLRAVLRAGLRHADRLRRGAPPAAGRSLRAGDRAFPGGVRPADRSDGAHGRHPSRAGGALPGASGAGRPLAGPSLRHQHPGRRRRNRSGRLLAPQGPRDLRDHPRGARAEPAHRGDRVRRVPRARAAPRSGEAAVPRPRRRRAPPR